MACFAMYFRFRTSGMCFLDFARAILGVIETIGVASYLAFTNRHPWYAILLGFAGRFVSHQVYPGLESIRHNARVGSFFYVERCRH